MAVEFVESDKSGAINIIQGEQTVGAIVWLFGEIKVSVVAFLSSAEWKKISDKLEELEGEHD